MRAGRKNFLPGFMAGILSHGTLITYRNEEEMYE